METSRREFTNPNFPEDIARTIDITQTAAYLAWTAATKSTVSFADFMKRAVELDTKWRTEQSLANSKYYAELRAARERNQILGPRILYELLTEKTQFVPLKGAIITEPMKLTCSTCGKKFDWQGEAKAYWVSMGGEQVSVGSEKELREFIERQLYCAKATMMGVYCNGDVPQTSTWRGRHILSGGREQCGAQLLGECRILRRS